MAMPSKYSLRQKDCPLLEISVDTALDLPYMRSPRLRSGKGLRLKEGMVTHG